MRAIGRDLAGRIRRVPNATSGTFSSCMAPADVLFDLRMRFPISILY